MDMATEGAGATAVDMDGDTAGVMDMAMDILLEQDMDLPITAITLVTVVALRHIKPELQAIQALILQVLHMLRVNQ